MFKIAVQPHFWQHVEHETLGDLEQPLKITFKVKYRRPTQAEVEELVERVFQPLRLAATAATEGEAAGDASGQAPAPRQPLTDQEICDKFVIGWDDVLGDDDEPLPYTPDNLARANSVLGVRAAIVRRFLDNFLKAPEKNSGPPPALSTR